MEFNVAGVKTEVPSARLMITSPNRASAPK